MHTAQQTSTTETETLDCSLCGQAIHGDAHDATPVADGPCCSNCHENTVNPTRRDYENALDEYERDREYFAYCEAMYMEKMQLEEDIRNGK